MFQHLSVFSSHINDVAFNLAALCMNLYTVMYKKKDTSPMLKIALPAKSAQ